MNDERDRTVHVIHHNDLDGICAAAIVSMHNKTNRPMIFYETNYNRPVDVRKMNHGDIVVIVDFSYPPEEMIKIEQAIAHYIQPRCNITWIDHHKTAKQYQYIFSGLRDFTDKGRSGCELTWQYFFPDKLMPRAVSLIGDYDSWRLAIPESREFYEGAKLFCMSPQSEYWGKLLNSEPETQDNFLQQIQLAGHVSTEYRNQYCQGIRKSYGYETELCGQKAYAMNLFGFGSSQFGELFEKYPLVIAYIYDGLKFTCSLYSEFFDVGEIAKSFGGGGHKGAAGFICTELPFKPCAKDNTRPTDVGEK